MKIKIFFFSFIIIWATQNSNAQEQDEFQLYYGLSGASLKRSEILYCLGTSFEVKPYNELGFQYKHSISNHFALISGLNYAFSDVTVQFTCFTGENKPDKQETFQLLSIPVMAEYDFWKYFFVKTGLLVDFQLSENYFDKQSGIGFMGGAGIRYPVKNFVFYLYPHYKRHLFIAFDKTDYTTEAYLPLHLEEWGVQIGIAYRFEKFFSNKKETQEKKHSPVFFGKK